MSDKFSLPLSCSTKRFGLNCERALTTSSWISLASDTQNKHTQSANNQTGDGVGAPGLFWGLRETFRGCVSRCLVVGGPSCCRRLEFQTPHYYPGPGSDIKDAPFLQRLLRHGDSALRTDTKGSVCFKVFLLCPFCPKRCHISTADCSPNQLKMWVFFLFFFFKEHFCSFKPKPHLTGHASAHVRTEVRLSSVLLT